MTTLRHQYPLVLLCRILEMSRNGYHAWRTRRASKCTQENAQLAVAIQAAHVRMGQTYGPERLQAELREDGFPAGVSRIKRLCKKLGLRCKQVRRFTTTTESHHALLVAANVLAQTFVATRPNETWVTDITYVPTVEGWLYLAGIKDLFTCEVVGYAMAARMTTALVWEALLRALTSKRPAAGLLHYSDRGVQYCAHDYQARLRYSAYTPLCHAEGTVTTLPPWKALGAL